MTVSYVAGKVIKVGLELRRPGDPVPEAAGWSPPALRAALGVGEVVEVFDSGLAASTPRLAQEALQAATKEPEAPTIDRLAYEPQRPRERKDIWDIDPITGSTAGKRIIQSYLMDDSGNWVEVAPGATELPDGERLAAPQASTDAVVDELAGDAAKRAALNSRLARAREAKAAKRQAAARF